MEQIHFNLCQCFNETNEIGFGGHINKQFYFRKKVLILKPFSVYHIVKYPGKVHFFSSLKSKGNLDCL